MIQIGLVVTNIDKMERWILEECRDKLKDALNRVQIDITTLLYGAIKNQPEWKSLESGRLRQDFGIPNSVNLDALLQTWCNDYSVRVKQPMISSGNIKGGLEVNIIDASHSKVLQQTDAIYHTKKGTEINWLEWLLFFGDTIVVQGFHVTYSLKAQQVKISRTGQALMGKGGSFKVNPAFSGTIDNNFITRAMDDIEDDIADKIIQEVERHI